MMSPGRSVAFALVATLVAGVGTVAAESGAADPQPGFGFLLAVIALLIAFFIARHKRRRAEAEREEAQRETASTVS